jgi:hypothetical protein
MAGLVPAIHVFADHGRKTWMPATSAGMTMERFIAALRISIAAPWHVVYLLCEARA